MDKKYYEDKMREILDREVNTERINCAFAKRSAGNIGTYFVERQIIIYKDS